jgi:indole-3-glycerol phosphate synthase
MKNVLNEILSEKKNEVARLKKETTLSQLQQYPLFSKHTRSLRSALTAKTFGIIAEIKRKSPSAGNISPDLNVLVLMTNYEQAGAVAISCLTDTPYFGGSVADLKLIAEQSQIPVLRKEFIIDEMQIFESKAFGADAILLISEALSKEQILHYTIIAQSLGMEVLLELHHTSELDKLNDLVDVIGINNRDLKAQKTDISKSLELIPYLPKNKLCISESGIKTVEELELLRKAGFGGALIGESILKSNQPGSFIESLNSGICS